MFECFPMPKFLMRHTAATSPTASAICRAAVHKKTGLVKRGDIVDYVLPAGVSAAGQHCMAIVWRVWGTPTETFPPHINLVLPTEDFDYSRPESYNTLPWASSVHYDQTEKKPGTWHWPEKIFTERENK